jgi:hypothetical protein
MKKPMWLLVLLCGIVLGLLAGRVVWTRGEVEAAAKKHETNLIIYPDGEVYVLARGKETINWFAPDPTSGKPKAFKVRFSDGLPCTGESPGTTDVSSCKVDPKFIGTALYSCVDSTGKVFCKDPGVDPNSNNDGPIPPVTGSSGTNTAVTTDDANVSFRVSCKGGKIVSQSTSPDTKVVTGIFWAYSGFKPGITIDDPQLCTSIQNNYGRGLLCKVNTSAPAKQYEITVTDKATTNKCEETKETVTH